ncbi:MAG: FecR domain-containing protein [Candidatus Omnitrophota bacterium]
MKRFLIFFLFITLSFSSSVFAQTAKIIDAKGKVLIKKDAKSAWEKIKINAILDKNAEIQTKAKSECVIAFDEELKNILTLKENSYIKIEDIKPGKINLPQGRVFSLIEDIKNIEKFEIRTPTAVAGVMGTGLGIVSSLTGSSIMCFQDKVYTQGLDKNGKLTGKEVLREGIGINTDENGNLSDTFELGKDNLDNWNEFKENINEIKENLGNKEVDLDMGSFKDTGALGELRQERTETIRETVLEERRERQEEQERNIVSEERPSSSSTNEPQGPNPGGPD